jgi:hypothetical protein
VLALFEGHVGDLLEEVGVVGDMVDMDQLTSSGWTSKWSSLSACRRASRSSISAFFARKASSAFSWLVFGVWLVIVGLRRLVGVGA